jgi:hypothetical protein
MKMGLILEFGLNNRAADRITEIIPVSKLSYLTYQGFYAIEYSVGMTQNFKCSFSI